MVNAYWDYHLDFIACHGDKLEGTRAGAGKFIIATVVLCFISAHATHLVLTLSGLHCKNCFFLGSSYGVCLIDGRVEVVNPRPRACCVDGVRVLNIPRMTEPRDNVLPLCGHDGILPRKSIRQENVPVRP